MRFFRKALDLSKAVARPSTAEDITRVSRLLRDGARRYYGLNGGKAHVLVENGLACLLEIDSELIGVAVVSIPANDTTWLRALSLADGVDVKIGLSALLKPLHSYLRNRGIKTIFYAGDETADIWLAPLLRNNDYTPNTDVVVYEKRDLIIPSTGNTDIVVRPVVQGDLPDVLRVDWACFEPQWTKDDLVLGPAIEQGPFFVAAELNGQIVGYAYATTHFGGRLVHLVRIAVDPAMQGQGIGVRLLTEVIAYADLEGAYMITLNTQAYNLNAQRLYSWFGFELTGERQTVLWYQL